MSEASKTVLPSFQFQLGAIGSRPRDPGGQRFDKFQFQLGAIGRVGRFDQHHAGCVFQFQLGAIGSPCSLASLGGR